MANPAAIVRGDGKIYWVKLKQFLKLLFKFHIDVDIKSYLFHINNLLSVIREKILFQSLDQDVSRPILSNQSPLMKVK